ncbi:DNA starvation/stationary phase protection protein [Bacillus sp. RG28]|uniref:DNA starvation/stationary phase protection protein n=1 Tax=Gottfriedia endophytica TaxID=2820819 RepID=A0A940NKF7_9BACI|nr:Dps family protein [Gottfriedia endophytica]MBP0726939.1 DNA starvation/stationary phase protection protein [Gottfriedia endophytica]
MNTLENALNQQLANWNVLYVKLHNYHWYVKGLNFFTLHEKFEQYYNDANTNIDEIGERILTIGGLPIATLRECLEVTTLTEGNRELNAIDMVADLIADYEIIVNESRTVINLAEENDDEETADLFRDKIGKIEKQLWMLKAFLG